MAKSNRKSPSEKKVSKKDFDESKQSFIVEGFEINNLEDLIKMANIDTTIWECTDFKVTANNWDVTMSGAKSSTKKDTTYTNYQWKLTATFKRKVEILNPKEFSENLTKDIIASISNLKLPRISPKTLKGNCAVEIDLFDFHFGKLGWVGETGTGSYDHKIAKKVWFKTINTLVSRSVNSVNSNDGTIEKFIFPIGNDFFNADNSIPTPTTTRGTHQQEDLRWQKTFTAGWQLIVDAIEIMRKIAPVDVIVVPGNHDFQRSYYLGDVIFSRYYHADDVNVDNDARPFKYCEYGNSLIGYAHGNSKDISLDRLKGLMQLEKKAWARTKFHEWHLGDIHHKKIIKTPMERVVLKSRSNEKGQVVEEDLQGIVIRYMRSISGDDGWHTGKGYLGSIKGAESYVYHRVEGPIGINNFNVDQKYYK